MNKLARLAYVLTLGLCVLYVVLLVLGKARTDELIALPISIGAGALGMLAVRQDQRNPIGWLFIGLALSLMLDSVLVAYVQHAEEFPTDLPNRVAAWASTWVSQFWITIAIGLIPVLFPTGRLLSARWRFVVWAALLGNGANILTTMVRGGPIEGVSTDNDTQRLHTVDNPFGIEWLNPVLDPISDVAIGLSVIAALLGGSSIIVRLMRARGQEREQLKLFTFCATIGAAGLATAVVSSAVIDESSSFVVVPIVGWFTFVIALLIGMPLTVSFAILKHGLYGVDRLINRTLTYALLTATLGATYFGLVVGLQTLLRPVSGSDDYAIVATTLIVAALFLPARRRVQDAVDRRFNRRVYDTARTIDAFSARLRDQIDLDTLRYELLAVVDETMQPARVTLWLRDRNDPGTP